MRKNIINLKKIGKPSASMGFLTENFMKILHITFHIGTANALESVLEGYDLTTKIVTSGVDGYYYNMIHRRAVIAWNKHKDFYNSFDTIIVSDTSPLSRIFIQNGYKGNLIVWVSNRFDYSDSREKGFPDKEYYELLEERTNFKLIANAEFESLYAAITSRIFTDGVINPVSKPYYKDKIPLYYVPTYLNDKLFNLEEIVRSRGLQVVSGRYKDRDALAQFKAIIHLPYTWNSIALWDALACGVPYYVPTKEFMLKLAKTKGYWFQNANYLKEYIDCCEFYSGHKFVKHFSSFEEIQDIEINHEEIYEEAEILYKLNRDKWINILNT